MADNRHHLYMSTNHEPLPKDALAMLAEAQTESLKLCALQDALTTYNGRPDLIQIIPGFTNLAALHYEEGFESGKLLKPEAVRAMLFVPADYAQNPQVLLQQLVKLIGFYTVADGMEGVDAALMAEIVDSIRAKYAIYQHAMRRAQNAEYCASRGLTKLENPVIQMGHPALKVKSQEWEGSPAELRTQVEILNNGQAGQAGLHESAKKTAILGACQITPQEKFADSVPPRIISIALPGKKFGETVIVMNPVVEKRVLSDKCATCGWFGDFGRRSFNFTPSELVVRCQIFDYESSELVDGTVEFANGKIIITAGEHQSESPMTASDPAIMELVLDLLDGQTPYDKFQSPPAEFQKEEVADRTQVGNRPGVFSDLRHYYGGGDRDGKNTISARNSAAVNARHILPSPDGGQEIYVPGYGPKLIEENVARIINDRLRVSAAVTETAK